MTASYDRFRPGEEVLARVGRVWHRSVVLLVWFNAYVVSPAPGKTIVVPYDDSFIRRAPPRARIPQESGVNGVEAGGPT